MVSLLMIISGDGIILQAVVTDKALGNQLRQGIQSLVLAERGSETGRCRMAMGLQAQDGTCMGRLCHPLLAPQLSRVQPTTQSPAYWSSERPIYNRHVSVQLTICSGRTARD
jgi:hypothetical protein